MSSITEALNQLPNKKVSSTRLLKGQEVRDRIKAENVMEAAVRNLKKKKDINSRQVENLEKD
jgi:hypothetical protein